MKRTIAPSKYLLDELIGYAEEAGVTFCEAATIVSEFAKQRAPELAVECQTRHARTKLRTQVTGSPKEKIVARFLVRTRVRYISWIYFPEYHVIDSPSNFWWCSIRYREPDWEKVAESNLFYLDDLFHDPDQGKFWMDEPYLKRLPASLALFKEFTKKDHELLEGTSLKKVDPRIVRRFKTSRASIPEFTTAYLKEDNAYRKPPYGSKGWQQRVALVPLTLQRVRLKI
jgi:hypothetical protein